MMPAMWRRSFSVGGRSWLQQLLEALQRRRGLALHQREQQAVLVAEVVLDQRGVEAGVPGDFAERNVDRMTVAHQAPGGVEQPLARAEIRLDGRARNASRAPARRSLGRFGRARGIVSRVAVGDAAIARVQTLLTD